jgi:hypothetical protein
MDNVLIFIVLYLSSWDEGNQMFLILGAISHPKVALESEINILGINLKSGEIFKFNSKNRR